MRTRLLLIALCLPLVTLALLAPRPAWAVSTLTGRVATMTGDGVANATFTMEREEDEKEGKKTAPVVVTADGSGQFKVENLIPGTYRLRSNASGVWATEAVTVRDGQTVVRWVGPSSDPENPGAGNFSIGVGGLFFSRGLDITKQTATLDDGTSVTSKSGNTDALNRLNKYNLDTNAGFVQVGYGLPRFGGFLGGGYVSGDTTVFGRVGAGKTGINVKGSDGDFSIRSDASAFLGGGANLKLSYSNCPIYTVFGFSWYYMDLSGLSTNEPFPAGSQNVGADGGSQFGWELSAVAGAKLGRLFPNQLPPQLGKVNVMAGLVGSWLSVDATTRATLTTSQDRVVCRPGEFFDSPPICTTVPGAGAQGTSTVRRSLSEQTAIGGRLGVTFPIYAQSNGLAQVDFSGDYWSLLFKLAWAFDP